MIEIRTDWINDIVYSHNDFATIYVVYGCMLVVGVMMWDKIAYGEYEYEN